MSDVGAGSCTTYHCYKGGPAEPPEGMATGGCPLYSHPAQLVDNRNCVLCMTCLKVGGSHLASKFIEPVLVPGPGIGFSYPGLGDCRRAMTGSLG